MTARNTCWQVAIYFMVGLFASIGVATAQTAPTPNKKGPYAVTSVEYKFKAKTDRLVTSLLPTEIWAVLWRPKNLGDRKHPIVLLVHGNHATCGRRIASTPWRIDDRSDYTTTGRCPPGYVVVPNHRGYNYLAKRLASWGMIVVSVNLNRGITVAPNEVNDPGLILRRARMVLRHLTLLSDWNSGKVKPPRKLRFDPRGKFDFSRIAMMGHSRGGDAIVAVPKEFAKGKTWRSRLPKNTRFRLLMALAPTDFQANRPIPGNAVFSTLLPMCDGDVSDMQGIRFFDRSLKLRNERTKQLEKSSFQVWGTNHNGYSTEWHQSDAAGCAAQSPLFPALGHSKHQQTIALNWVLGLTRSTLLGARKMDRLVDPSFKLPQAIASRTLVDRGFVPTIRGRRLVHALDSRLPGGCVNKLAVTNGVAGSCTRWPEHDEASLSALVRWGLPATAGSASPLARFRAGPTGNLDLSASKTLDVQFGPDCFRGEFAGQFSCTGRSDQYPSGTPSTFNQPVSVFLEDTSGRRSAAVRMDRLASSRGPIGSLLSATEAKVHALMRTARIPMKSFGSGFSRRNVRYVWFDFRPTAAGGFVIGEISGQTVSVPAGAPAVAEGGASVIAVADPGAGFERDGGPTMGDARDQEGVAATIDAGAIPLPPPPDGEAAPAQTTPLSLDTRPPAAAEPATDASQDRNRIVAITRGGGIDPASGQAGVDIVRIEVQSSRPFPATGAGLTLTIGDYSITEPDPFVDGAMDRAVFEIPVAKLRAKAKAGDAVSVRAWSSTPTWRFGGIDGEAMR